MNLKNLKVRAVALVDRGANRRKFYLLKRMGGFCMDKELAIALIKSMNKEKDKDLIEKLIAQVPETERAEVEAFAKAAGDVSGDAEVEALLEKAGAKFSKATTEALNKMGEHITAVKAAIDDLLKGMKEGKYPYPMDAAAAAAKKAADEKAAADAAAAVGKEECSPEELAAMMEKAENDLLKS